jgi:hypothetical protein
MKLKSAFISVFKHGSLYKEIGLVKIYNFYLEYLFAVAKIQQNSR